MSILGADTSDILLCDCKNGMQHMQGRNDPAKCTFMVVPSSSA